MLEEGANPIHGPGLEPIVARNRAAGRLQSTTDTAAAFGQGTMQFIGADDERATLLMRALYQPFMRNHRPLAMDLRGAELIVYAFDPPSDADPRANTPMVPGQRARGVKRAAQR